MAIVTQVKVSKLMDAQKVSMYRTLHVYRKIKN